MMIFGDALEDLSFTYVDDEIVVLAPLERTGDPDHRE